MESNMTDEEIEAMLYKESGKFWTSYLKRTDSPPPRKEAIKRTHLLDKFNQKEKEFTDPVK